MCMTKKNKTMKIKQLSYLLLGAALCGCTTDTTEEAGTKKTDADFIVRATVGDDGQTRADMTEDGLRFSFSAEDADRIGLYLNYPANDWTDQNLCFEAVNSQTKGWVDFKQVSSSTFAIQEGLNVYAYYPYEENEAQVSGTTDGTADSRAAVSSNWGVRATSKSRPNSSRLPATTFRIWQNTMYWRPCPPRWSTIRTILPR